mgnify:CR=1 FL=1
MVNQKNKVNTKSELANQFHTKLLDFSEYLKTFDIDDNITEVYNNSIEFRLCLIRSKVLFLKEAVTRSLVIKEIFEFLPFQRFLDFIKEDIEGNAETIDNISKNLKESKGMKKYEDKITEVQKKWDELFSITRQIVNYLVPNRELNKN